MFANSNTGVRWQEEMEEHLKGVKENLRISGTNEMFIIANATKAQAHATAALALAVANGLGDIEGTLDSIRSTINERPA